MRGRGDSQTQLFYLINVESQIRRNQPYENGRQHVDRTLAEMSNTPADAEKARADRKANIQARLRMQSRQKTTEYSVSQRFRKKVEGCFGWIKTIGGLSRSYSPDRCKLEQQFTINAAAYNYEQPDRQTTSLIGFFAPGENDTTFSTAASGTQQPNRSRRSGCVFNRLNSENRSVRTLSV